MPNSIDLRHRIDDLALKLVIEEPGTRIELSNWLSALESIRSRADSEQAEEVGRVAASLLATLRACEDPGSQGTAPVSLALQDGIARLQQALEVQSKTTSSADVQPAQDPELI